MVIFFHFIFWFFAFSQGIFQLFGLPSAIYKIGSPITVLILVILKFYENKKINFFLFKYIGTFILVAIISSIYNDTYYFTVLYFLFYTCIHYFYFIVILNEYDSRRLNLIYIIVMSFFIIQIPAAIIKFMILGQSEKGAIGTLSTGAGSLSSIVPLFAIAFIFSRYLYDSKKIYLILIIGFTLFGLIGEKRVIVVMIPIVLILTYFIYSFKEKLISFTFIFRNFFIALIGGSTILYMGIRLNPTLNPDKKIFGRFDFEYFIEYIKKYESSEDKPFHEKSRTTGVIYFTQLLFEGPKVNFLIGDGTGKLVESEYNPLGGSMLKLYNVRYGGRMGFVWMYLQVGLLGVLFYILFYISLIKIIWVNYKSNSYFLAFIIMAFVNFFDFIVYSDSSLRYEVINSAFLSLGAILIKEIEDESLKQQLPQQTSNLFSIFNTKSVT